MELTKREKESYELFTRYKRENPGATNPEAYKATGTNSNTVHVAKKKMGLVKEKGKRNTTKDSNNKDKNKKNSVVIKKKPKKQASEMQTIIIPEVREERQERKENFAVIICNQQNLQDVLNAIR